VIYSGNKLNTDRAERWSKKKTAVIKVSELCVTVSL
jgi:hypothetical protein